MRNQKGVSLMEVLIGIVLLAIICIASLSFFTHGLGGIGREGNRRAALERARERLEELLTAGPSEIKPAEGDPALYWVSCTGGTCTRTASYVDDTVSVDELTSQRIESTVQWRNDPSAGTTILSDVLELVVKVWYTSNTDVDNDYNRVHLRTLRTP